MPNVYYKRLIEGKTIPAIIQNGGYHYINMPIYEDGSVDCWHRVGLSDLKKELSRGWLVTEIPIGKIISIHGLGAYTIHAASWNFTPDTYIENVISCVKQMNQEMVGLFRETFEQKEKWKTQRVSWGTSAKPYKIKGNFGYQTLNGESTSLLYKTNSGWQLTSITAYSDGTFWMDATNDYLTFKKIKELFAAGILSSAIEGEVQLSIPNFGLLTVTEEYQVESVEKLKEIEDISAKMNGEKTVHEICRNRYIEYLIYPSEQNREQLRVAYENVPEHERMYLGDMDSKDFDYQRILYHPDQKREV